MVNLSNRIQQLKHSATLAINEHSKQLIAEGKTVYRLGFGQSPFPVPVEVVNSLKQAAPIKDYLPVKGLMELREAVANYNQRTIHLPSKADNILIGPGSKELLFTLQLATDGVLLLPSPSWVSYEPQAFLADKPVVWIDTNEENAWKLKATDLAKACEQHKENTKILVLNYPNNPVGNTYSADELKAISEVAQKYDLLIVADEIYGGLNHQNKHISIAQFCPKHTIVSNGLSKWCGAGGWRLGTFSFPDSLSFVLEAMAKIASETFTSVSAPIQYAAITAFKGSSEIDQYLLNSKQILQSAATYVYTELRQSNITMPLAEGGFYLFPNFEHYRAAFAQKGIYDSVAMCTFLLEEAGVALLPGVAFGRPKNELTVRLSYVDFDGGQALELIEKDQATIEKIGLYAPNIIKGIKQLQAVLAAL